MRIAYGSDLHLECESWAPETGWFDDYDVDVLVLAGDIHQADLVESWVVDKIRPTFPVIHVPGNHEYYASSFAFGREMMTTKHNGAVTHLKDGESVVIDGVMFVGGTLWTDYKLNGTPSLCADTCFHALSDARLIADLKTSSQLTQEHWNTRFAIDRALQMRGSHLPSVVVTHHAPSPLSIHPRYEGSPLNAAFASDLEGLIDGREPSLWIHGHTHSTLDYKLHSTRIVCNPRGYLGESDTFDAFTFRVVDLPV